MENDPKRRFAGMSDSELQECLASKQFDENARALLTEELNRRGLSIQAASHVADREDEARAIRVGYRQLLRGLSPLNAQILLGRLQAEGVDAYLSGANIAQTQPLWFYALGGVRLFVHGDHLATAFEVINAAWNGGYEVEDEQEEIAGMDRLVSKRKAGRMIVMAVALVVGGISLIALWWPSLASLSYAAVPRAPSGHFAKWVATAAMVAYAAFWLLFVESAVRRQKTLTRHKR